VECKQTYHPDLTCREYAEALSQKFLRAESQKCPNTKCSARTIRGVVGDIDGGVTDRGCYHMTCEALSLRFRCTRNVLTVTGSQVPNASTSTASHANGIGKR